MAAHVAAIDADHGLTQLTRSSLRRRLVRLLRNRLSLTELLKRYPEIESIEIETPFIVVGCRVRGPPSGEPDRSGSAAAGAAVLREPGAHQPRDGLLHEDPDRAWAELGEHILWEAVTYGGWSVDQRSLMHLPGVQPLDEVRASGRYRFLTPEQLIAEVREASDYGPIVLHRWSAACLLNRRGSRWRCSSTRCFPR